MVYLWSEKGSQWAFKTVKKAANNHKFSAVDGPLVASSTAEVMLYTVRFVAGVLTFAGVWNLIHGFVVRYTASHDEEKMRTAREQMWSATVWLIGSFVVAGLAFWIKKHYLL